MGKKYTFRNTLSDHTVGLEHEPPGPISNVDADDLKRWLNRYAIQLKNVGVYHITADGHRHRDNALARTIGDTVGSAAGGIMLSPVSVPIMGVVMTMINPVVGLWISLGSLLASIGGKHYINKRTPHVDAIYSEIEFQTANVSETRRGWFEYLAAHYVTSKRWSCDQLDHVKATAGYRKADAPPAWIERLGGQKPRRTPAVTSRQPPGKTTRQSKRRKTSDYYDY